MNLAIVGYGKMGKLIEQLAAEHAFTVRLILDEHNNSRFEGISPENFAGMDVAIEFSVPSAAVENIERISSLGVNLVVGSTGWLGEMDRVRSAVARNGIGLVWSPNFSIGVQAFFRLAGEAARLLREEENFGAWAWEIHHAAKKDAPSGTLLKLVETMRQARYARRIDIASNRAGAHPGTHEIGFDSTAETITLRHTARSREGFARGALQAAQWLVGKKGLFEFSELLFSEPRA